MCLRYHIEPGLRRTISADAVPDISINDHAGVLPEWMCNRRGMRNVSDTQKVSGAGKAPPPSADKFAADPLSGKIGAMLRESYREVVEEGIPDDFLALLKKADDA